jgi:hypothetical protein
VGEIDPLGTRREGLDAFLDQKVEEGYVIETRTDTHAIISQRPKGLKRLASSGAPGRYVVEVDEDGSADASGRAATHMKRYLSRPRVMDTRG